MRRGLPGPRAKGTTRRASTGWGGGLLLALLGVAACANPVPPTGGPEDRTPPRVVAAVPTAGAVQVQEGIVTLTFSEPVDAATVARALNVTPEPDAPPEVATRGRTVTIHLGSLRPNTTYVLTFGTELRDLRSVPLGTPLTYAFSTGDQLDAGALAGRVVDGPSETPRPGLDVLAFASADSAAAGARALYRTQTGADGTFRFSYLGPAPLFVVALEDRNRNRRVDGGEAFAAPPRPALTPTALDSVREDATGADSLAAPRRDTTTRAGAMEALLWRLARPDTTPPRAERVRSYSTERHAVRYPESVRPDTLDPATWRLADTTGAAVPVLRLYRLAREPRQVFFETPPLAARPYVLTPGPVVDSAGVAARPAPLRFVPSAARDTVRLRLVRVEPADGRLVPGEAVAFALTRPLADSSRVSVRDTLGGPIPFRLVTDDGTTYRVAAASPFDLTLALPGDSARVLRVRPYDPRDLGSLSGVARLDAALPLPADALRTARVHVEATGPDGRRFATSAALNAPFSLEGLPAGAYRLTAFLDLDDDGRWTPGRIAPYRPAEPAGTRTEPVTVRARWDTALPDTLVLR